MDTETLLRNLREEVSCPVCSEKVKDPRQLSCLHSFCLHCLKHWHQSSGGEIEFRCPKCQALSRVPESGDLKDLPSSFYLNGLMDVLAVKESNKNEVACGNCDTRSAESSYCFQCCLFYCEQCLVNGHNMMRNNKSHHVLALKEFQDEDYEDVLKRPDFCPRQGHQNNRLKYFCKGCEAVACDACVTLDHRGHTLKLIEEEAEIRRAEMRAVIEKQKQTLQAKMNQVAQLDEEYDKLVKHSEGVKREIEAFADGLIKTIEAKKENIFAASENQANTSLEGPTTRKAELQQQVDVMESVLERAEKMLPQSNNAEVVELKKCLEAFFGEIVQTEDDDHDVTEDLPALVFVENQNMLDILSAEGLGSIRTGDQTNGSESHAEG